MKTNQEKINLYNDKIEMISTNIEMLNKIKNDANAFVKVTSVISASAIPTASIVAYLSSVDVNKIALCALIASAGCVSGIYAGKKHIDSNNKEIDFKIHDSLRAIDVLTNKVIDLEQQDDNEIASTLIENRANILKRTM